MRATRADTRQAVLQAAGLHVLLFALMFAGLHWTRSNVVEPAQGDPIEADLIDPSALSASMQRALRRDPAPLPEPVAPPRPAPPDSPPDPIPEAVPPPVAEATPPPPLTAADTVDQEKIQPDAPSADPARAQPEQDARQRQQQVDLDAEKARQLADIRKQQAAAAREVALAEQKARQLADASAQQAVDLGRAAPLPGNRGTNPDLLAKYSAALQQAILRQWTRPESVQFGQRCQLSIRQLPGGEVVDVRFTPSCPFDELGRQSVERAVLKASPLPYAGFQEVFARSLTLNFVAEGD